MTVSVLEIVASIFTILFAVLNVVQFLNRKNLDKLYYSSQFRDYNDYYRIGELLQIGYQNFLSKDGPDEHTLRDCMQQSIGIVDSARHQILAFTERYMGKAVWRQHVTKPDEELLRRTKK